MDGKREEGAAGAPRPAPLPAAKPRRKKPPPVPFEVGNTYRKVDKVFLAVAVNILLTITKGKPKVVKPHKPSSYSIMRNMTIVDLCEKWKVTEDVIDAITAAVMPRPKQPDNPRRKGRRGEDREAEGLQIRLVRVRHDRRHDGF